MNDLITGTQCDLCGEKTSNLTKPASLLNHIPSLEWMCIPCSDRLSATLTTARKFVHKYIADALATEAESIREESE